MGTNTKDIAEALEETVKNDSEISENEDFKLGAGGAATTGYGMNKKNSNTKMSDMSSLEDKNNQKEILNLLSTLLSLDIHEKENLSEEEEQCKTVLFNRKIQSKLGIFGSNFLSNFINLQSCSSTSVRAAGSLKNKQSLLKIINQIILLLSPEVIAETINPKIISRQLKLFLSSSNGYHSSRSLYTLSSNINITEQKYIFTNLNLLMNILKKTENQSVDFKIPMIREGILDIINHICTVGGIDTDKKVDKEENKEKSPLPTVDYINSQISSSKPVQYYSQLKEEVKEERTDTKMQKERMRLFGENVRNPFKNKVKEQNTIDQKMREDIIPYIKKSLSGKEYEKDNMHELNRISRVLGSEISKTMLCKEALNRLSKLLIKNGMTYYEATKSNIIENLHKFVIRNDGFTSEEKSLWNRIHMFIDEFADNQKGLTYLIQNLHNLINDDESIEDLHISDNSKHSFYVLNRWADSQQIEII